ncbi:MAG: hypothetical protein ACI8R4_003009 [Paracoccaceae bacterium]|jgi:hypothetical protein
MADHLNDASTDVDKRCNVFITAFESECAKLHLESKKIIQAHTAAGGKHANSKPFPEGVKAKISPNKKGHFRTPKQQAVSLTEKSHTCWGAHMSDMARHILVKADGSFVAGLSHITKEKWHQEMFKTGWVKAMKTAKVVNWLDKLAWGEGDEFHLQIAGAYERTPIALKREAACVEEYLRLTRVKGKAKNTAFEAKPRSKKMLERASKKTKIPL